MHHLKLLPNNYGDDRDFKRIISNMFLAMASPCPVLLLLVQDKHPEYQ
jgi:hypothetical protein